MTSRLALIFQLSSRAVNSNWFCRDIDGIDFKSRLQQTADQIKLNFFYVYFSRLSPLPKRLVRRRVLFSCFIRFSILFCCSLRLCDEVLNCDLCGVLELKLQQLNVPLSRGLFDEADERARWCAAWMRKANLSIFLERFSCGRRTERWKVNWGKMNFRRERRKVLIFISNAVWTWYFARFWWCRELSKSNLHFHFTAVSNFGVKSPLRASSFVVDVREMRQSQSELARNIGWKLSIFAEILAEPSLKTRWWSTSSADDVQIA